MSLWLSAQVRLSADSCGNALVDCKIKKGFLQDKSAAQRSVIEGRCAQLWPHSSSSGMP